MKHSRFRCKLGGYLLQEPMNNECTKHTAHERKWKSAFFSSADSIIDTIIGLEWQHLLSEAILLDRDSILLMSALIRQTPAQPDDGLTLSIK